MRRLIVVLALGAAMCGSFVGQAWAEEVETTTTETTVVETTTTTEPATVETTTTEAETTTTESETTTTEAPTTTLPATTTTLGRARGLDASQRPTAAGYRALAAGGYEVMGRYLEISPRTGAPSYGGKWLWVTQSELANARAAGVGVFLIFEWCSARRDRLPNGYTAGVRDASIAVSAVVQLGLDPGATAVYFSLDRAHRRVTTAGILDYFRGVASVYPGPIGCYGSRVWLMALQSEGLATYLWHAWWMDKAKPFGHMLQKCYIIRRGGVWCDQNWILAGDVGATR